jgi:hypothetical protein
MFRRISSYRALLAGLCTVGLSGAAQAALTDNLELYYNFNGDSTAVGDINDQSGNSRDGSGADKDASGTIDYLFSNDVQAASFGSSLNLGDTTDYVISDTPGYNGITGANARTVAAWVKLDSVGQSTTIMEWGTNVNGVRWAFRINSAATNGTVGGLRVEVAGDFVVSDGAVGLNGWHHVAATFVDDGSPVVEDALLYIDGVLQGQSNSGGNSPAINTSGSAQVTVGSSQYFADDRQVDGLLDEVAIWSRALSAQEIGELASNPITPIPEPSSLALLGLGGLLVARRRRV